MEELRYLQDATENLEAAQLRYEEIGMTVEEAQRAIDQAMQAATLATKAADDAVSASIHARDSKDAATREEADVKQREAMESLYEAQRQAEMVSRKHITIRTQYSQVQVLRGNRERIEEAIRRHLDELRAGGWKLPVLPAQFQYLFEPAKSERRRPESG